MRRAWRCRPRTPSRARTRAPSATLACRTNYGAMLPGFVMYSAVNAKACERFSTVSFRSNNGARPNFALVERGDCYFPTKVWNAQQAGAAAAVLVMDNKKEVLPAWQRTIMMDSPDEDPWPSQYLQNVSIPSALISKEFGDKLKAALEAKELVTMELDLRFIRNQATTATRSASSRSPTTA